MNRDLAVAIFWSVVAPALAYFAIAAFSPAVAYWLIGPLALGGLFLAVKRPWE